MFILGQRHEYPDQLIGNWHKYQASPSLSHISELSPFLISQSWTGILNCFVMNIPNVGLTVSDSYKLISYLLMTCLAAFSCQTLHVIHAWQQRDEGVIISKMDTTYLASAPYPWKHVAGNLVFQSFVKSINCLLTWMYKCHL